MPTQQLSPIVRGWLAFAAVGTGLIHLALVIGAPVPLAVLFGVLGFVEFAWGVLTFVREPFAPRVAIVVAVVPVVAWGVLITLAASGGMPELAASIALVPLAVATLFELFIVAVLGSHVRRAADPAGREDGASRTPGTTKYLIGISAGALVVASLTSPALAATEAGQGAVPHGGTVVEQPFELELPEHGTDGQH
ncbi:MAG: hypothetical protein M3Y46_08375 [Actinomycetota bacterium]|nr:hypothetical protein [Actinomycetota bacterium]